MRGQKPINNKQSAFRLGLGALAIAGFFAAPATAPINVLGFVDFSNNTGFVNEPQVYGIELGWEFGD